MSNLKSKAKEVYDKGVEQRGEFAPTGVPLRMWKYWAKHTKPSRVPARENFCHFWRVVAIWSPLMFLKNQILSVLERTSVQIGLGLLALAGIILASIVSQDFLGVVLTLLGIVVGLVACVIGIMSGYSLALDDDDMRVKEELPSFRTSIFMAIPTLPVSLPVFLANKFIRVFGGAIKDNIGKIALVFSGLFALAFVILSTIFYTPWSPLLFLAVAATVLLLAWAGKRSVSFIGDYLAGKRALAKEQQEERKRQYLAGEITLEEYMPTYQPSKFEKKIGAFFSGIVDFIILAAQVIRVNKWKICPTVEVDK